MDRESNDLRLRQAIQYLEQEGGPDSVATYADRVQKINDSIVKQYRNEKYSFDRKLYRTVQSLVKAAQSDLKCIPGYSSSNLIDGDSTAEDLPLPSRYHDAQQPSSYPDLRTNATVIGTQFLYGGPNNEVEEYRDMPGSLQFGENPYMQTWESMKINHDLKESAKDANQRESTVWANVPYHAVRNNFSQRDIYDSGSRFKLPDISEGLWSQIKKGAGSLLFPNVAKDFNNGGVLQHQVEKDCVPRIFLPPVSTSARRGSVIKPDGIKMSNKTKGKGPIRPRPQPAADAGPSRPRNPVTMSRIKTVNAEAPSRGGKPAASRFGTINPEVLPQARKHPQKAPASTKIHFDTDIQPSARSRPRLKPRPTPNAQETNLKKFDQRRAVASGAPVTLTTTWGRTIATTGPGTSTSADQCGDEPENLRPAPVATTPSIKRGAGESAGKSPKVIPSSRAAFSRPATGKRKLDDGDDSYDEPVKKPRIVKTPAKKPTKTPAKPSAKMSVKTPTKKSVSLANHSAVATPKSSAKSAVAKKSALSPPDASAKKPVTKTIGTKKLAKTAAVKKSAPKTTAGKIVEPNPQPLAVSEGKLPGREHGRWGTTRSGHKFKSKA